jgi:hypothetical protein
MRRDLLATLALLAAVLILVPAVGAAGTTAQAGTKADPDTEGTCTITIDCYCPDEPISCSGPTGTCSSGGSGCDEWVQCGSDPRVYCPTVPEGCDPLPECFSEKHCDLLCDPYPGFCNSQGCCICA